MQTCPTVKNRNAIPEQLKLRKQWVLWKYVKRRNKGGETKITKAPFQLNGKYASSNNPETWDTFENLIDVEGYDGVGFCFAKGDNLVGIDLDKCIQDDRSISPWAMEILTMFSGTYQEITPSGKGFHIICQGRPLATGSKKWKDDSGNDVGFEIYDYTSPRYFTVTGDIFKIKEGSVI